MLCQASSFPLCPDLPSGAVFILLALALLVIGAAISTTARIVFFAVLITHLTARFASSAEKVSNCLPVAAIGEEDLPELPSFLKSRVKVCPNDALVQLGSSNILQAIQRILVGIILDEAKAAGRFVESVEAHYKSLDLTAPGIRG